LVGRATDRGSCVPGLFDRLFRHLSTDRPNRADA
jgi:hypothetical protein